MDGRTALTLALATLLAVPALGYGQPAAGQCPYDDVPVRCPEPPPPDACHSNTDCPSGKACCFRACNKDCYPVCQPACSDLQRCILQDDKQSSVCTPPDAPPDGAGSQLQCPYQDVVARCLTPLPPDDCSSNTDCPYGQACCFRLCNKDCYPGCKPACRDHQRCILQDDKQSSVCTPPDSVGSQLLCPYDDLGPRIRCRTPLPPDDCSSNTDCPSGKACCFRGCNKSCQPACTAPCFYGLRCTLRQVLGVSSCQYFKPLQ